MSQKTAVFLDLDGTLWDWEVIPESARDAILKARENGHYVFANTGRARASAKDQLEHLRLDGFVYSAGSEIWFHDQRIYFDPLPKEKAEKFLEEVTSLDNVGVTAEASSRTFNNERNRLYFQTRAKPVSDAFLKSPLISEMGPGDFDDVMKVSVNFIPEETLMPLLEKYQLRFTPFNIGGNKDCDPGLNYGEITQLHNTKGTAMEKVREALGGDIRTMAIGDSENDIPMLEAADISFAMGNGTQPAKEAAQFVTTGIHDNGLYNAFQKAGLLDKDQ